MKIAIHQPDGGIGKYWIAYCIEKNIPYKIVNCYSTDIINNLDDCDALMWHHNHANPKDLLFAKELLYSLESKGKLVYPNTKTTWSFDDKLGQKYQLEAMKLPLVPTFVFFSKQEALEWISKTEWPIVFKLRSGAGGRNVRLLKNKREARRVINKAFGKGIRPYNAIGGIKESVRRYRLGKATIKEIIKSILHVWYPVLLENSKGREKGYVYFQKFIPDCKSDVRVKLVGERIWAKIRNVRKNDFRASHSGDSLFDPNLISKKALLLSLEISRKLKLQSVAIDLLPYNGDFLIAEISYAFGWDPKEFEAGYWDAALGWHPGKINPFGWIVEDLINTR